MNASTAEPTLRKTAPPANRNRRRAWNEPRVLIGLLLVGVSILAGVYVVSLADQTSPVYALARDLGAGAPIGNADLVVKRVRLADDATSSLYLTPAQGIQEGTTATRDLVAGELLAAEAVSLAGEEALVEVPIAVNPSDLPATVAQGARVDIWVAPSTPGKVSKKADAVLSDVLVIAVPGVGDASFVASTEQQVIVGVPADRASELKKAIGSIASGRVVVTRRSR